jgi:Ice-binding-like
MQIGVPQTYEPPSSGVLAANRVFPLRAGANTRRAGLLLLGLLSSLAFASSAFGAAASVGLGSGASFSVLGGSTVTNTGPTTMFGSLGLSPGPSVTGAPHVLGQTHIDDAVAIGAKNELTTAYNDAASRPSNGSAGTDLASQTFTPGVRTASSSLLLSSGSVTLNAEGNPDAVFIFQIGSTLITGSNTAVTLINGAQACNVFWQVGSSATLGTGTRFVGTIMASATITANTAATIHGRLLAQTGAVNMDTNTITMSTCVSSESGSGGGTETSTPEETATLGKATKLAEATAGTGAAPIAITAPGTPGVRGGARPPIGSRTTGKHRHRRPRPRSLAHRALPHKHGAFTG